MPHHSVCCRKELPPARFKCFALPSAASRSLRTQLPPEAFKRRRHRPTGAAGRVISSALLAMHWSRGHPVLFADHRALMQRLAGRKRRSAPAAGTCKLDRSVPGSLDDIGYVQPTAKRRDSVPCSAELYERQEASRSRKTFVLGVGPLFRTDDHVGRPSLASSINVVLDLMAWKATAPGGWCEIRDTSTVAEPAGSVNGRGSSNCRHGKSR